jgi:long-subunit acyl-CoA synthetase (AMP-forming)
LTLGTLYQNLERHPDGRMRFLSLDGSLITKTFPEVHADVVQLMAELRDLGVEAGDLVGLTGPNCYDWVVADLALLALECVSVALPGERGIDLEAVAEAAEKYGLSAVLVAGAPSAGDGLPVGVAWLRDRPLKFDRREPAGDAAASWSPDVFSVAFSSGTSGSRKGLLMSKRGVQNTIEVSGRAWAVDQRDDVLIVMPFSNFQQRYLTYLAIWYGFDITVVPPERLFQKLKELAPTIILGPPSFFEVAYNRVQAAGAREKLPYRLATALHAIAPGAVSRPLRRRLGRGWTGMYGPRVRLMLTGSAPVPPATVRLFQRLGAPLYEVYGSTEVGWIAFNSPKRHRIGSAGRPVAGLEIALGEDGEILVATDRPQSPGYVFEGVETQSAVHLPDGRIATGDLGRFGRDGFLRLIGRKKNVIITRSGVKINPEELELALERDCRITRAMVAPRDGGLLACVVWLDDAESEQRRAQVEEHVAEANAKRPASHRIAEVLFRPDAELTVESGLLTRNLKVDRNAVMRVVFAGRTEAAR